MINSKCFAAKADAPREQENRKYVSNLFCWHASKQANRFHHYTTSSYSIVMIEETNAKESEGQFLVGAPALTFACLLLYYYCLTRAWTF